MRRLNRVKGRLLHYSVAISHLRILVTELGRFMGPVSEEHYDCAIPTPPGLRDRSAEICGVIRRFAPLCRLQHTQLFCWVTSAGCSAHLACWRRPTRSMYQRYLISEKLNIR